MNVGALIGVLLTLLFFPCPRPLSGVSPVPVKKTRILPLPEISRPVSIKTCGRYIYIVHGASVSIYSLPDYGHVKTFGKLGEGPREFKLNGSGTGLFISVKDHRILVNSIDKVSFFTKRGEFIGERKVDPRLRKSEVLGDGFVGRSGVFAPDGIFICFNLYDRDFNKIKEFHRSPLPVFRRSDGRPFRDFFTRILPVFYTVGDTIYVSGRQPGTIRMYDKTGAFLRTITLVAGKKRKITDEDKERIKAYYKTHRWYRADWETLLPAIVFPEYFPVMRTFMVTDTSVFVQTYMRDQRGTELMELTLDGRFKKSHRAPLGDADVTDFYLYTIHGNRLYRLVENPKTDEWDLHVIPMD